MTYEEIVVDLYAHQHMLDPHLRNEVTTDDFEGELAALEARAAAKSASRLPAAPPPIPPLAPPPAPDAADTIIFEDRFP